MDVPSPLRRRQIAVVAALVAIVAIIATAVYATATQKKQSVINNPSATAMNQAATEALLDKAAVTADRSGFLVAGATPKAEAPTVAIYSDAQCPWCKLLEYRFGGLLTKMARDGEIVLEHHPVATLQGALRNTWSTRAIAGMACAAGVGQFSEYNAAVFGHQPREGDGFTDELLSVTIPATAGITGDNLSRFQACYAGGYAEPWATTMDMTNQKAMTELPEKVGTPTMLVNGTIYDWGQFLLVDPKNSKKYLIDTDGYPKANPEALAAALKKVKK